MTVEIIYIALITVILFILFWRLWSPRYIKKRWMKAVVKNEMEKAYICPYCGALLYQKRRFCPECGRKL